MKYVPYFLILMFYCPGSIVAAENLQDPASCVRLIDIVEKYPLGSRLAYLEDPSGEWTIDQIASGAFARRFQFSREESPNFGYTDSTFWAKVTLDYAPEGMRTEKEWLLEVDYVLFDEVTLYVPQQDGDFLVKESGDLYPFANRDIRYRNPVFRLLILAGDPLTVYVRIRSKGSVNFPLTLWSSSAFTQKVNDEHYVFGIFYGILLIMALFNLFLFFSVKDRNYLYYVLYILGVGFTYTALNGFAFQYLWPASPWWANQSLLFFMGMTQCAMALFARSFLRARENAPRLDKILFLFLIQSIISMTAAITGFYAGIIQITNAAIVLEAVVAFIIGIICIKRGYRPAVFFTLAFFNYLAGGTIYSFKAFGLLPTTFFTTYAIQIGSMLEVTILAFALADRINMERREKLLAQKEALEAQKNVVRELQKVDRLKDAFLANTSHELRTPLNGIIGIAESLLEGAGERLPRAAASNLSMIVSSGRRLAHLVNDILDFSRLKSRDIALKTGPVDIQTLTDTVITVLVRLASVKHLKLVNLISEDIPPVSGDEDRLQQILYNLIGNAVKFTDSGEIIVSAVAGDSMVEISISDTGVGIPQDKINDIFLSFEQADASDARAYGGAGLGLSITRQLVELHGGRITAESEEGKGSTLRFTIPLSRGEPVTAALNGDTRGPNIPVMQALPDPEPEMLQKVFTDPEMHSNKGVRVLAVDDDPVNLQVVSNHLSSVNITVTVCAGGAQAVEIIEKGDLPDLVLLDIMMPRMTGYEVCRKLRETWSKSDLPIIMLTAKNMVTDLVQGFESGANDYLVKPFTKDELIARVQNHLKLKESYHVLRENLSLRNELVQRRQTIQDLKMTQRRLSLILDEVEEAVLAFNENGEINFCSRSCARFLGYDPEDILGMPLSDLLSFDDMAKIIKARDRSFPESGREEDIRIVYKGKNRDSLKADISIAPMDLEDERLFMMIMREPDRIPDMKGCGQVSALRMVDALNRNRDRIRALEESLNGALAKIREEDPAVVRELKTVDAALEGLGRSLAGRDDPEGRRLLALEVMQIALEYWTEATGETKFDLARRSMLWQVYTNLDGWERTQTLDRYLDPASFPQKPRMNKIIETADFVLATCHKASPARDRLEISLERLRAMR